jgi:hypothetical protein
VLVNAVGPRRVRLVTHLDVDAARLRTRRRHPGEDRAVTATRLGARLFAFQIPALLAA